MESQCELPHDAAENSATMSSTEAKPQEEFKEVTYMLHSLSSISADMEGVMTASRADMDEIRHRMASLEDRRVSIYTSSALTSMPGSSSQSAATMNAVAPTADEQVTPASPYNTDY